MRRAFLSTIWGEILFAAILDRRPTAVKKGAASWHQSDRSTE